MQTYVELDMTIQCISTNHLKFPNMSNVFPTYNASEEGDHLLSLNHIFGLKYVLGM